MNILNFLKQIFSHRTKKQKGVGLFVGEESFSLCVIYDMENVETTTKFYGTKFPATIKEYATDFFTNGKSTTYILDYIKEFMPQGLEGINLILPDSVASIAVTPVQFASDEQALGYAHFQTFEIFNRNFTEPIFSVCRIEGSVSKNSKQEKSRYIVSCAEVQDMIALQKCAVSNQIDLTTAEPLALCALRAYCDISQGNVLFVFINLSQLFLVTLVNGRSIGFYTLDFDVEEDGFLKTFSEKVASVVENFHFEQDSLKIKIAGNEIKYKICEALDKLNIAKEIGIARCKMDIASCEDELAFGAALRNS